MLKLRIITAVALLAVLLPALFAPSAWPFALVTLALLGAGGWEWGRLNNATQAASLAMGLIVVVAGLAAWKLGWIRSAPALLWWGAGLIWVVGGALALRAGPAGWPRIGRQIRWVLGLLALWLAWLALAQARHLGVNVVVSVMCLVWAADVATNRR